MLYYYDIMSSFICLSYSEKSVQLNIFYKDFKKLNSYIWLGHKWEPRIRELLASRAEGRPWGYFCV